MSTVAASEATTPSTPTLKNKKSRKKKPGGKAKASEEPGKLNGIKNDTEDSPAEDEVELDNQREALQTEPQDTHGQSAHGRRRSVVVSGRAPSQSSTPTVTQEVQSTPPTPKSPNRHRQSMIENHDKDGKGPLLPENDTEARLEAMARDRVTLKDELAQLRILDEVREKHEQEMTGIRRQLEDTQREKEHAETQYRNLLGKVNTIKSQLGERLKADAEDLAQARSHIEDLEEANASLKAQNDSQAVELARREEEAEEGARELSGLRNRMNLSQQNWVKEREDLLQRETFAKEEFESARQAMQDWEVLAMEERSIRDNLTERVSELEEQVNTYRDAHQRLESERDSQTLTVDGLQRALQELQDARKRELRELVENSQAQVDNLRKELKQSQHIAAKSTQSLDLANKELDRVLPFEMEVKEKNLLIGKLRHEAVILNDHLTKALKQLKRGKPEDTIDRQLVTNHFLHFLALDRSDPKKFQVLQIMASLLNWTDEQREQAGLARPGASNPSLRTPISPWHRTPSTPSLSTEFLTSEPRSRGDSLAGTWTDFLETEAQNSGRGSRSTSVSTNSRRP